MAEIVFSFTAIEAFAMTWTGKARWDCEYLGSQENNSSLAPLTSWDISDIAALVPDPVPVKRGSYKKNISN